MKRTGIIELALIVMYENPPLTNEEFQKLQGYGIDPPNTENGELT